MHYIDIQIGANVKRIRKRLECDKEALADMCGLEVRHLTQLEAGNNRISASVIAKIALALGVPISSFFQNVAIGTEPRAANCN